MKEITGDRQVLWIVQGGMTAAVYVVLTIFIAAFNLANGAIQVRISEALTIMPYFTPAAIPGVTLGCLISNIVTGCTLPDIIFGSLATLIGAVGTYLLRGNKLLCSFPPVVSNTIIVPLILKYAYGLEGAYWYFALTVGLGELVSCVLLGQILLRSLEKVPMFRKMKSDK